MYGPLYYRALESAKSEGLRAAKGNYSFRVALPSEAKLELTTPLLLAGAAYAGASPQGSLV